MTSELPAKDAAPYRQIVIGPWPAGVDFWTAIAAGFDLRCCKCDAVLGSLFMPFSGGFFLAGSSARLDPRLVERDGPEKQTGFRRYGPPSRVFAKGKRRRSASAYRPELRVHGSFWVYCYSCNTGQAVEPERFER